MEEALSRWESEGCPCEIIFSCSLKDTDVQTKLIDFFAAHRDVTEVTFVGCDLGASGASMLANGLRSFSWTSLTVRDDCIEAGMSEFCEALASNETLKSLMLAGGPNRPEEACLHADSAKLLANVLRKNRTLVSLALPWNAIGDEGAISIAEALACNTTLQELNLELNRLHEAGARAFLACLATNGGLDSLMLRTSIPPNKLPSDRARSFLNDISFDLEDELSSAILQSQARRMAAGAPAPVLPPVKPEPERVAKPALGGCSCTCICCASLQRRLDEAEARLAALERRLVAVEQTTTAPH